MSRIVDSKVENGTVDCHYEARVLLKPTEMVSADKELAALLEKFIQILRSDSRPVRQKAGTDPELKALHRGISEK